MAENRPVEPKERAALARHLRQTVVDQFRNRHRATPHLPTIHGPVQWGDVPGTLQENSGVNENDNEIVAFAEYYKDGELVHRSVHVHLKRPAVDSAAEVQSF